MKKFFAFLVFALLLSGQASADIQIDKGADRSTNKVIFFVGRYARTTAIATSGNMISKDRIVVWDKVSNDGVTVDYSTTSNDSMVAGVAMDNIPGSSRDSSAVSDVGASNWGRIQVWGRHADVSWDQSTVGGASALCSTGTLVGVSARNAGAAGMFIKTSADTVRAAVSTDSAGFLLESPAASDKTVDIFLKLG